jgi:phage N-6-adenine-methyltransferase
MSPSNPEWFTPQHIFDALHREFKFTLDPCATPENAKCPTYYTRDDDGLSKDWAGHTVFMNPPYGDQIGKWVRKAWLESLNGTTVVCLIPSRTDTSYWHDYVMKATELRFIYGRVTFGGVKRHAPFPSVIVVFRPGLTSPAISAVNRQMERI